MAYRTAHFFRSRVHYDKEIECAVLGICLLEEGAAQKLICKPEHFYFSGTQFVCGLIHEMVAKKMKIDLLTIVDYCYNHKKIEKVNNVNADYFICRLTNQVTSSVHLLIHQHILIEMAARRQSVFDRFDRPKPKPYGLSIQQLRLLLAKATPKRLRAAWPYYGKKTIGESSDIITVPNEYCVFLMHLYRPELTWTCERYTGKSFTMDEIKEIFKQIPRIS